MPEIIHEGISYQQSTHAIYCKSCKETIRSVERHDFNQCSCGKVFIDGGISLGNRVGGDLASMEDRSTYFAMIDGKKVWLPQEIIQKRLDDLVKKRHDDLAQQSK